MTTSSTVCAETPKNLNDTTSHKVHDNIRLERASARPLHAKPDYIYADEFDVLTIEEVRNSALLDDTNIKPTNNRNVRANPPYLSELYAIPLLTPKGEVSFFRKYNYLKYVSCRIIEAKRLTKKQISEFDTLMVEADEVRNQIIKSNLRLVVSIARKFSSPNTTFEELVSEGNTILINAVEKFDYSRGFRFSTYVTHSVQRHFYRHLHQNRDRKVKELVASTEILQESVAQESNSSEVIDTRKADLILNNMDRCLDEREQFIVRERFGFGPSRSTRTYQSLSDDLGICKERVRQVFNASVEKLRNLAAEMNLEFSLT